MLELKISIRYSELFSKFMFNFTFHEETQQLHTKIMKNNQRNKECFSEFDEQNIADLFTNLIARNSTLLYHLLVKHSSRAGPRG